MFISSQAWAATQWVATNGSDGNSCFAGEGSPRQTIDSGQACLSAGDTLMVKDGTYNHSGTLVLDRGGSDEGSRVIYKSQNFRSARIAGGDGLKFINVDWVTFDGFFVDGMEVGINNSTNVRLINAEIGNSPDNGMSEVNAHNFELINLYVHDNGIASHCNPCFNNPNCNSPGPCHGFYIGDASNGLIDGGVWSGNYDHAIHGRPSCGDNLIIRNATFKNNNAGVAIGCYSGSNVRMYNNVIFDNLGGIQNETSSGQVVHNTVYNNGNFGIKISDGSHNYQNNIVYDNGGLGNISVETGGNTFSANLCNSTLAGVCDYSGDPNFRNPSVGDFHINLAGSPANNNGIFTSLVTTDHEGNNRGNPPEIGAFEFDAAPPPPDPDPIGLVGWYKAEGNADDSSGNGFHGTLTGGATFGAGIVDTQSFLFDGVNDAVTLPANAAFRPTGQLGLLMWMHANILPSGPVCRAISNGVAYVLGYRASDGLPFCDVNGVGSVVGPSSVINDQNHHLACSYDGFFLRLYIDAANPSGATQAASGSIVYTGSEAPVIGGVTDRFCPGRIDGARIYDQGLTAQAVLNDFNSMNPSGGVSVTHMAWYAANAPEGTNPSIDSDIISPLTTPKEVRWAIHNSTTVSGTQYVRPFYRVNAGAGYGAWTELTNSFGSTGARFLNDTSVNLGDATAALLPLDGFTATAGKFLADVVDLTSPYDAIQKITIGPGQHAELAVRFELGSPLIAGNQIQFKPRDEFGVDLNDFGGVGDPVIKTLTVQAPPLPGSSLDGGTFQGVGVR